MNRDGPIQVSNSTRGIDGSDRPVESVIPTLRANEGPAPVAPALSR
jgi:hypothetical protein